MKKIPVTLHISEVEYDVQNRTYADGKFIQAGGKMELGGELMITDDDWKAHFVRRCTQDALGKLLRVISEYVEVEAPEVTNVMLDDGAYEFKMIVPDQLPDSAAVSAVSAMHEYISNDALSQWYFATDATKHSAREKAAEEKLQAVRSALNKRVQYARCMRRMSDG